MEVLHIIIPVAVGALIGYCTNYIAIKMLFHPYKEVRIGNWKLPFTPGVIPKNQPRIAQAVGNAVSGQLLTSEDILHEIKESSVKESFIGGIEEFLFEKDNTIGELLNDDNGEIADRASMMISDALIDGVQQADLKSVIAKIASNALGDILDNPLVSMFLSGDRLDSIYENISSSFKDYIKMYGKDAVMPVVKEKITEIEDNPIKYSLDAIGVDREPVREIAGNIIDNFIEDNGMRIIQNININDIVQRKIEEMDAEELEKLVFSVMKHELQAVINLGALIGAVIGIINIFI